MRKRTVALFLAASMVLGGCSSGNDTSSQTGQSQETSTQQTTAESKEESKEETTIESVEETEKAQDEKESLSYDEVK